MVDICKTGMMLADVDINTREHTADERKTWLILVRGSVRKQEETRYRNMADRETGGRTELRQFKSLPNFSVETVSPELDDAIS